MPLDEFHHGRVKSTEFDLDGNLLATLDEVPEDTLDKAPVRFHAGEMARPRDGQADAIYFITGDAAEVLVMDDPAAMQGFAQKAGQCAKGERRLCSLGTSPQGICLKDDKIKIGAQAQDAVVKGTTYRNAEATLNAGIKAAYLGLPVAATDLASALTLLNAIRVMLLGLANGAYATFENGANNYLSSLIDVE